MSIQLFGPELESRMRDHCRDALPYGISQSTFSWGLVPKRRDIDRYKFRGSPILEHIAIETLQDDRTSFLTVHGEWVCIGILPITPELTMWVRSKLFEITTAASLDAPKCGAFTLYDEFGKADIGRIVPVLREYAKKYRQVEKRHRREIHNRKKAGTNGKAETEVLTF